MAESTRVNTGRGALAVYNLEDEAENRLNALLSIKPRRTMSGIEWHDEANNRSYQRIIGGLAWPSAESLTPLSSIAILGEDKEVDVATGQQKIWILYEDSAMTIEDLLDTAVVRMEQIVCSDWIIPMHEPEYVRVERWSRERKKRRMPVPHFCAPPSHDFVQLNALMQARTVSNKSFYFGKESPAATLYVAIPDADFNRSLGKYPAVAAVLYPLGYLDMTQKRGIRRSNYVPAQGGY